ncbi:MAG: outer membrane beta-barrel protein [Alphaproteobacteria bacterium]|nr:outer membrane beta-barrel protein [Alphaproteobacteria bacterium]
MRNGVIKRGVMLAAIMAANFGAAHGQAAPLQLKPTVSDDVAASTAVAVPAPVVVEDVSTSPRKIKKALADPYAPTGLDTGGLRLYPTLEVGGVFTSNVTQANTGGKSDFGLRLKPGLRFESDWSRHSWTGQASADILRYMSNPSLSTLTGSADTTFRLDIRRTTRADFTANFVANETGLGDTSLPGTAIEPRRDKSFGASVDLVHDFGGLEGAVKLALARSVYDDVRLSGGGTENNSDRAYIEPSLTLRATLGYSDARLRPYAEVAYAPRTHDLSVDRNGNRRDSQGFSGALGVNLNDGPIWQGDVALTYLVRNYADAGLQAASALGLRGRLGWSPTELLKFEATSGVDLGETAVAGIGGTKTWSAGLSATYGLWNNLEAKAGLGVALSNTGSAVTSTTTATAGLDWKMNPNMSAGILYQGTWFGDGTAAGTANYDEQRVMTRVVFKR